MDNNQEILPLLRAIAKNGSILRLMNLYKGLPIIYDASILSIEPQVVRVRCNKYQLACLFLQHEVYLIGDQIQGTIHAEVSNLVPAREEAVLTNLQFVDKPYILREQVRIEPQDPIFISLQLKGSLSPVQALLADISLNGLGVYLDRLLFHPKLWAINNEVSITIPLPEGMARPAAVTAPLKTDSGVSMRYSRDSLFGLGSIGDDGTSASLRRQTGQPITGPTGGPGKVISKGVIVNIRSELILGRHRLGIRLDHEQNARALISQFISQRQSEIIREFKTIYESLVRFSKT